MAEMYIRWSDIKNALIKSSENLSENELAGMDVALSALEKLSAADVAPVVHGRWNGWHGDKMVAEDEYRHYHYYSCNECGRKSAVASNYCPNCGARMDGE